MKKRVIALITVMVCLLSVVPVFGVNLSGVIGEAQTEVEGTLQTLPSLIKPIFYIVLATIAFAVAAVQVKGMLASKQDNNKQEFDMHKRSLIGIIVGVVAIAIGMPLLIKLLNLLFSLSLVW